LSALALSCYPSSLILRTLVCPHQTPPGLLGRLAGWCRQPLQLARQAWQTVWRYKGVATAGLVAVAAVALAAWKAGPLLALAGLAAAAA
jgi:hypothetical protein